MPHEKCTWLIGGAFELADCFDRVRTACLLIMLGLAATTLSACSQDPSVRAELVALPPEHAFDNTRAVYSHAFTVGRVTGAPSLDDTRLSDDEFRLALEWSLRANGLLASNIGEAKYRIDADFDFDRPIRFFDQKANMMTSYKVIDVGGKTFFDEKIDSTYTKVDEVRNHLGPVADILFFMSANQATANIQEAYQGAASENIAEFLKRISERNGVPLVSAGGSTGAGTGSDLVRCRAGDGSVQMKEAQKCLDSGGAALVRVQ